MSAVSTTPVVPSTLDRVFAPFYLMNALFTTGKLYSTTKNYFHDPKPDSSKRLFVDSLYACAAVTSSLYWANAVQWIAFSVPYKLERTLNFTSFLARAGLGEHTLRIPDIRNDPHPVIRLAYEVTSVVYAIFELIALYYTSAMGSTLKIAFLIASFGFLGLGTYYANIDGSTNASRASAPASV